MDLLLKASNVNQLSEKGATMADKKGNIYLYEAIELRNEYDSHIQLLEGLLGESTKKRGRSFFDDNDEDEGKEAAADFNHKEIEKRLKKLQTKRVKLNQVIQKTNFNTEIDYQGKKIGIAEALEVRKNLLADLKAIGLRVERSSFRRVIHKEGRDIVQEPRYKFADTYREYQDMLRQLRRLVTQIHTANHLVTVGFKDE